MASRARVGIDATVLDAHGKGVARYVREMLPALAGVETELELVALLPAQTDLPEDLDGFERLRVLSRPASLWEQVGLPRAVRAGRLSLVHTTSDRLPVVPTAPIVVYLFEDPKYRLASARGSRSAKKAVADLLTAALFPLSLRRAALILVSSQATARDVGERGVPAERIRLVYPGVSESFRPARDERERRLVREELGFPDGFVLHFSSDDPRDNSDVVLAAYAEACRRLQAVPPLVVAGPVQAALEPQRERARALGLDGRVHWLGFQSGERLARLYRAALAYLDPSLFEGFGFQVAEALASGLPVVCADATSLPEVVGDAGLLVDPRDVGGFAEALCALLADADLAQRLRERAVRQGRGFSWRRAAEETVAAWTELLRGSG